ncbi:MAG: SHOCT domain-containing protein [Patescibacteria group bacterium]
MIGDYYGHMFGWGLGGGLMMVLFWAAIILFIIWIVRGINDKGNADTARGSKSALDILKERYAKGEIDKKEFEEKKKDLTN